MITQKGEVLRHLKEHGSITSIEAFKLYGATRLASIIFSLRKTGYNIETIMKDGMTRYGGACQYAEYYLREDK